MLHEGRCDNIPVLGQGSSLVRANGGGVTHGLASSEDTDQVVVLQHAGGGKGKSQGDGQGKTLGDGDDDNGDTGNDNADQPGGDLAAFRDTILEGDEEADEQDNQHDQGSQTAQLCNLLSQAVQLGLKRGILGLGTERHHGSAVETVLANTGDDVETNTLENLGARDNEWIDTVEGMGLLLDDLDTFVVGVKGCVLVGRGVLGLLESLVLLVGDLFDGIRLSGHGRLVALEVVSSEVDTIGGDDITGLEVEDITDDDVVDGDEDSFTVAEGLDLAIFLLGIELAELSFLLVIVDGSDEDDDHDGEENGDTLDPGDLGILVADFLVVFVVAVFLMVFRHTIVLIDTEGNRDDGSNQKQDLLVRCNGMNGRG